LHSQLPFTMMKCVRMMLLCRQYMPVRQQLKRRIVDSEERKHHRAGIIPLTPLRSSSRLRWV
jgi:hypothetical protein